VHERRHPRLKRDGTNLYLRQPVAFTQAALGADLHIQGLEGDIPLHIPPGTQSGTVLTLRGHGLPALRGHGRGDLLVEVAVEVPTKLTAEEHELLQRFAKLRGESVLAGEKGFFQKVKDAFRG